MEPSSRGTSTLWPFMRAAPSQMRHFAGFSFIVPLLIHSMQTAPRNRHAFCFMSGGRQRLTGTHMRGTAAVMLRQGRGRGRQWMEWTCA